MTFQSGFPMPKQIELDKSVSTDTYGKFIAEPFQSGYGHTLGNALRRVLLSSLEGASISAVRIEGVAHEFASIPHVIEDVTEIVLNLKKVKLIAHGNLPKILEIKKSEPGEVTAADIITDGTIEIVNPNQLICTIDKPTQFNAELEVISGIGWNPAEKNKSPEHPLGTIAIDSLFSPVERVRYEVGATRVGEATEMDSLILEIWTDGRIMPQDALEKAAMILQDHLRPFLGAQAPPEDVMSTISEEEQQLFRVLSQDIESMELSVRAQNCLNNANIKLIGELCMKTENKLLKYRNFGKKSLDEIKEKLQSMNLSLGMELSDKLRELINEEVEKVKKQEEEENS